MDKRLPPLKATETALLDVTTRDLVPMLNKDQKLRHVRQMAFEFYDKELKQEYQVHVLVTRDRDDFLEPFQTEEME